MLPSLEAALSAALPQLRWFPAKGREIAEVVVENDVELLAADETVDGSADVRLLLLRVSFADGEDELYQVPLALRRGVVDEETMRIVETASYGEVDRAGPALAHDALADPRLTRALLDGFVQQRTADGVTFVTREPVEPLDGRLLAAEQSNSSVVFGDQYILKLYRRVRPGLNPDLEVTRALTEVGCPHIASIVGWVESTTEPIATLGILQPFYRSGTDGWASAVTSVRDLYAEGDLHADEVGGDFAGEACRIGHVVAAVHADLARALPTESYGAARHARLAEQLVGRLDTAVAAVPELAERREAIAAAYAEIASLDALVPVQRIHGDLHLGQLLRVDTGWVVLDFEGEPARPLADRTALMSPLRDVAGMLRSFDYAAQHLLAEQPGRRDLERRAEEWAERNREAFCDGYAEASSTDPRKEAALLRAFELDKAVYETVYEARNRPAWLGIPLSGIDRIIGVQSQPGDTSG
ncbi:MAG TPA: maltokinase [Mycobacteriales bacterium]|nr:maltokinase [Mycobacteriales bacterium]